MWNLELVLGIIDYFCSVLQKDAQDSDKVGAEKENSSEITEEVSVIIILCRVYIMLPPYPYPYALLLM